MLVSTDEAIFYHEYHTHPDGAVATAAAALFVLRLVCKAHAGI
jgi:hypothetical protein